MKKGGRNLAILAIGAIGIAVITTGVSLVVYDLSGDIYLDRSRPGYLPDESESADSRETEEYVFSDAGEVNKEALTEYLQEIQKVLDELNQIKDPYAGGPLSNESLGIPEGEEAK